MKCVKCGIENQEGIMYCTNCGSTLNSSDLGVNNTPTMESVPESNATIVQTVQSVLVVSNT